MTRHFTHGSDRLTDADFLASCRAWLQREGALVLRSFFEPETVDQIVSEVAARESEAFFASSTHNVYLTEPDPELSNDHPFNRQVASSKGLLADDQIARDSPLREIYDSAHFRKFLCDVLEIEALHPYADDVSSINVHFAPAGRELGWHFDNSSFAVTMLLQAPTAGGVFEYVPAMRDSDAGEMAFEEVGRVLDGVTPVRVLEFAPGDLVLFRGRNALHRVTPTEGTKTRLLVVFAFNEEPGIALSASALETFYGRQS